MKYAKNPENLNVSNPGSGPITDIADAVAQEFPESHLRTAAAKSLSDRQDATNDERGNLSNPTSGAQACDYVKPDGAQCKNPIKPGAKLCWFHDPEKAEERMIASRAGGQARGPKTLPSDTPDVELRNMADLARLSELTINQIRRGEIDHRIAWAMMPYVGVLRIILSDFNEERITALEQALESGTQHRGRRR